MLVSNFAWYLQQTNCKLSNKPFKDLQIFHLYYGLEHLHFSYGFPWYSVCYISVDVPLLHVNLFSHTAYISLHVRNSYQNGLQVRVLDHNKMFHVV
jgi:hypothetical protein